jgi:hypothetical protein
MTAQDAKAIAQQLGKLDPTSDRYLGKRCFETASSF